MVVTRARRPLGSVLVRERRAASLHLQDLAGERNADLAGLAVGGVLAADFVGVQLSAASEVFPGLVELDPGDGFRRGRAHVFGDFVELDGLLGDLRRLIVVAAALKAEDTTATAADAFRITDAPGRAQAAGRADASSLCGSVAQ